MLKKGDKAPSFELESSSGGIVSNESLKALNMFYIFIQKITHQAAQKKQ